MTTLYVISYVLRKYYRENINIRTHKRNNYFRTYEGSKHVHVQNTKRSSCWKLQDGKDYRAFSITLTPRSAQKWTAFTFTPGGTSRKCQQVHPGINIL